jgi:hypothetical protein
MICHFVGQSWTEPSGFSICKTALVVYKNGALLAEKQIRLGNSIFSQCRLHTVLESLVSLGQYAQDLSLAAKFVLFPYSKVSLHLYSCVLVARDTRLRTCELNKWRIHCIRFPSRRLQIYGLSSSAQLMLLIQSNPWPGFSSCWRLGVTCSWHFQFQLISVNGVHP